MIENLKPNINKPLLLVARLVFFVVFVFIIIGFYSNYKVYIKMDWLAELLALSILLVASWFYRVSTEWSVELDEKRINIRLTYNLVMYGKSIIRYPGGEVIFNGRFSSNTDVPLVINSHRYVVNFKRSGDENFFRCSIKTEEQGQAPHKKK